MTTIGPNLISSHPNKLIPADRIVVSIIHTGKLVVTIKPEDEEEKTFFAPMDRVSIFGLERSKS